MSPAVVELVPGKGAPVSEHVFKFLLDELNTVRVVCKCQAVLEVPLEKLATAFPQSRCHLCGAVYDAVTGVDSNLAQLAGALAAVRRAKENFRIEFVLPDHSGE